MGKTKTNTKTKAKSQKNCVTRPSTTLRNTVANETRNPQHVFRKAARNEILNVKGK